MIACTELPHFAETLARGGWARGGRDKDGEEGTGGRGVGLGAPAKCSHAPIGRLARCPTLLRWAAGRRERWGKGCFRGTSQRRAALLGGGDGKGEEGKAGGGVGSRVPAKLVACTELRCCAAVRQ